MKRWTHGGPKPSFRLLIKAKNHFRPSSTVIISIPNFSCNCIVSCWISSAGKIFLSILSLIPGMEILPPSEITCSFIFWLQLSFLSFMRFWYLIKVLASSQAKELEISRILLFGNCSMAVRISLTNCLEWRMRKGGRIRRVYWSGFFGVRDLLWIGHIIWMISIVYIVPFSMHCRSGVSFIWSLWINPHR